jgi:hypothetical protein
MTRANCRYHRLTEVQLAASNVRVCISMKPDVTRGPAASETVWRALRTCFHAIY